MKRLSLLLFVMLAVLFMSSFAFAGQYDLGGATLRLVGHNIDNEFEGPVDEEHVAEIEALFNVDIEFVTAHWDHGEVTEDLESSVLAGEGNSIYKVDTIQSYQYAAEGFFYPLDHFSYEKGVLDKLIDAPEIFRFDGQKYFFNVEPENVYSLYHDEYAAPNMSLIAWNKTKFEEQGLPNLYDLYEAGEWTWDTFLDVAIDATQDTTGDGEIDQWGFSGYARWEGDRERAIKWILTNDAEIIREVDGNLELVLNEPEAIEAMEFLQRKVDEGVVAPMQWEGGHDHLINGKSLMLNFRPWTLGAINDNMEDDFGIVPFPKGPNADQHVAPKPPMHIWSWAIPATTDHDPEALMALIRELYKDSTEYVPLEELADKFWAGASMLVRDRESVDNMVYGLENISIPKFVSPTTMGEDIFNMGHDFMGDLLSLERSPGALVDEYYDVIQTHLDEM